MDNIVDFSALLRENGIPVSIRSTCTGKKVQELISEDDPSFKEALASVYVKEQKQRAIFNRIFEDFFIGSSSEDNQGKDEEGTSKTSQKSVWSGKSSQKWKITSQESDDAHIKAREIKSAEFNYHPPLEDYVKDRPDENELLSRDINTLNSFEPELFLLCQKMGKKIAMVRSRRQRQAKIMRPDVRRTIRRNLQNGGCLIDLVKSKPRVKKKPSLFFK